MKWQDATIEAHVLPGWEPLVDELHQKVLVLDPNVQVVQVKEKFGGLRYYFDTDTDLLDEIDEIVRVYENRSFQTCEVCGQPAPDGPSVHGSYWLKTLCPKHAKKREETGLPAWKLLEEERSS